MIIACTNSEYSDERENEKFCVLFCSLSIWIIKDKSKDSVFALRSKQTYR